MIFSLITSYLEFSSILYSHLVRVVTVSLLYLAITHYCGRSSRSFYCFSINLTIRHFYHCPSPTSVLDMILNKLMVRFYFRPPPWSPTFVGNLLRGGYPFTLRYIRFKKLSVLFLSTRLTLRYCLLAFLR